jgi:hypothetical protein
MALALRIRNSWRTENLSCETKGLPVPAVELSKRGFASRTIHMKKCPDCHPIFGEVKSAAVL